MGPCPSKLRQKPTISWTEASKLKTTRQFAKNVSYVTRNYQKANKHCQKVWENENSRKIFAKISWQIRVPTTIKMQN